MDVDWGLRYGVVSDTPAIPKGGERILLLKLKHGLRAQQWHVTMDIGHTVSWVLGEDEAGGEGRTRILR